jgi:tetratricopeptide (TPR) repeat protein
LLLWFAASFDAVAQPEPATATSEPAVTGVRSSPAYPDCDVEPDERAMAAAKGAFEAGNAAFNEADYPRAITYWEDAYRRDCTAHPMLRNLARAYELDGHYAGAIAALETFLARQPNSGDEASIQRRIDALKKKLEDTELQAEPAQPVESAPEPEVTPPPEPPPAEPKMARSTLPLYVAGGGALVGLVGGVLWFPAYSTLDEIDQECPNRDERCPRGVEGNQARSDVTLWGIVGGVGATVAVAGVVWYFLQEEQPVTGLVTDFGPNYAGLRYSAPLAF